jgi:hypothetical protein
MMHRQRRYQYIGTALLSALVLVACAPPRSTGSASMQATTVPPTPTQAPIQVPTSTPATTTPELTPVPPSGITASPTPTFSPMAQPSPTPVAELLLPNDVPWVFRAGIIYGDDESFDFQQRGYPAPGWSLRATPNGYYIAYISQQDQLVVIDMRNGKQITPEPRDIHVAGFAFSPDSRELAYRVVDGPLQILDLASEQKHSIPEPPTDQPLTRLPVEWSRAGLLVERLLWGSDAPPQGLDIIDTDSGMIWPIREHEHLRALVSPDSRRMLLATGSVPIGGTPKAAITIMNMASGFEMPVVPERQQVIKALAWSPDGSRLLYAESVDYQSTVTTLHVLNADATPEQVLELGARAGAPAFTDIVWRDNDAVLLLSAEGGPRLQLYRLPLDSFTVVGLQPIMGIRSDPDQRQDQIVYSPQVP